VSSGFLAMKTVLIAGAGGFGREVAVWLSHSRECGRDWHIGGFLDDNPQAASQLELLGETLPVVGRISSYQPQPGQKVVLGVGVAAHRRRLGELLVAKGAQLMSYCHPSALVGLRVKLGQGVFLCPYTVLTCDVDFGDFSMTNLHVTVGHDAHIGVGCSLYSHVDICGGVTLGDGVTMGSGARVLPGLSVGAGSMVGAGAVVTGPVRAQTTVIGNPARVLR
jgi:sugar O-acyltransferase (sialic acid O-acetyltransferase NeuD family)